MSKEGERLAVLETQHKELHDDIKALTVEVKALRTELTKGKGVAVGVFMVLGAAYTFITQFLLD